MKKPDSESFWKHPHARRRHSILFKLLLVLGLSTLLINLLAGGFFRILFRNAAHPTLQHNLVHYLEYIIQDIGEPPRLGRAFEVGTRLGMKIRYEAPEAQWSTSVEVPNFEELHFERLRWWKLSPQIRMTWKAKKMLIEVRQGPAHWLFMTEVPPPQGPSEDRLLMLLVLLTLVLGLTYLVIRRILQPLGWLMEGVRQVGEGQLEYQIPSHSKDELGRLAASFNQMTRRLREMLAAKQQLLWDVSHELRSPLTRIRLALEFMPPHPAQAKIREDLDEMEKMIEEILEAERLKSPHGALDLQKFDLVNLVHQVTEGLQNLPPGVRWGKTPPSLLIQADAVRLKKVVKNILENALKYSPPESLPVEVQILTEEAQVVIMIVDHGPGIPANEIPFLFEPFYRVDKSRSKATGGYGLGLSLCQKIIESHGGTIQITSQLGQGTSVKISLPQAEPHVL